MKGHPRIEETRNQTAIKVGPLVYCIESPDLPPGTSILDVYVPSDILLEKKRDSRFLGGVTTLIGNVLLNCEKQDAMYQPLGRPLWQSIPTQFVPYYAWSNRGTSEMTVWFPVVWKPVTPDGQQT